MVWQREAEKKAKMEAEVEAATLQQKATQDLGYTKEDVQELKTLMKMKHTHLLNTKNDLGIHLNKIH